jgi:sulfotransferase
MSSRFVGVAGLPRAGSTLLCQLLAEHPEIDCEGHSSPLCNSLLATRRFISDDQFMLSQLDVQFDASYAHLKSAMQGFLHGWHSGSGKPVVVDKNRARLHQKTILLDFIDHLADFDRFGRADQLFAKDKAIGAPLSSIQAVQDLPQAVKDRLYFVKFEDLMAQPVETMSKVYAWLEIGPHSIDPMKLTVHPHESDSHYRHKYRHQQYAHIVPPAPHDIPLRIQELIEHACGWYYEWFYPRKVR